LDDRRCNIVCWKDAPTSIFIICYVWKAIRPFLSKVGWWKLVWHKHIIPHFSFIFWLTIREALSTQDKLISYCIIQANMCLLYEGGGDDIDHLFFGCPFSQ
jgi:hypothetical protein